MTRTNNKKGTSLVELLAVIVIMGIIAAIAVPTVGALLKNTRRKAAGSDIQTLISSIETFRTSEGVSVDCTYVFDGVTTLTSSEENAKASELLAYLKDPDSPNTVAPNFKGSIQFAGTSVTVLEKSTYEKDGKTYTYTANVDSNDNFKPQEEK